MKDEFRDFVDHCGGWLSRKQLHNDSALGSAWKLGEDAARLARARMQPSIASPKRIDVGISQKPLLNAVVTKAGSDYASSLFWPLPVTLQGVSAAIWANPLTAPWIGDVSKLAAPPDATQAVPPGFDIFFASLGKGTIERKDFRSGVRIDHIDAIVAAGDARWEAFLATWMTAIEFVWAHEIAHVLYGHADIVQADFGVAYLYESRIEGPSPLPSALSQFMEHVADVDAALNLFTAFYDSLADEPGEIIDDGRILVGSCSALGIVLATYVLGQAEEFLPPTVGSNTHPPLGHRTIWMLGAESLASDEIARRRGPQHHNAKVAAIRNGAIDTLRSVAQTHWSLERWISPLNAETEDRTNQYLGSLRKAASPYFQQLERYQLVR